MATENPMVQYKISPETFEVATEYVKTLDSHQTAKALDLPHDVVVGILDKREVKKYIDAIFLEQGYLHRNKLNDVMTDIINMKLEEMSETGMGSNKDILELLKFVHQMRMDYDKANKEEVPGKVTNVQNNFGDNYSSLMEKIIQGKKPL